MDKLQELLVAVKEMHDLFPMSAMRLVEAASDLQFALASGEVVVTTWEDYKRDCQWNQEEPYCDHPTVTASLDEIWCTRTNCPRLPR